MREGERGEREGERERGREGERGRGREGVGMFHSCNECYYWSDAASPCYSRSRRWGLLVG